MPLATLTLDLPDYVIASLRLKLQQPTNQLAMREFENVLRGMLAGAPRHRGHARLVVSSAHSSGYYDCVYADAVLDTDTVTIGGTALAYVTTPGTTAQFTYTEATDAGVAAGLANAINANATINRKVRGYATGGRCYVVCLYPSALGDAVTLAETGNGFTRSGATLASGAADAPYGYQMGYTPTT